MDGRVAVVTGGGRGIGRAIATVLAGKGAAVAVWDLNAEGAEATADSIRAAGGTAIACAGDAADAEAVAAAAARTREELGPVGILVNNAGISAFEPFLAITEDSWERVMRINLKGPFLCTQSLLPDMLTAGWGRIVNISSSSAQTGAPAMGHYAASKGGVIGFTKALAVEFASQGITVNNVPPGFVDTPMLRESPVDVDQHARETMMGRAGTPDDIAYAVAYLASDEAGYVTGQTLSVNGGRYLV
ncbi:MULTISPECIES: SDR family NAD(P)-dependent oxidoreductase [Microbacterium]|uniref:SDR family NAD(P)-dependent oxidoreductase n=1 Tax=Microbacterium TaxID=33882 RepID=UPI00214D003C|nr:MULTISPECIES: SDR family NAD(P)-dependent oxidoreductase [unclassified Microbacterium]MCR2812355.1 SDR family oxidoreductase [Microbacterium sp. zg.Y1084]MDL5485512.1 SDR family NAD(P)-dependent oxidoreductase [Microbacterium sp. zg-Y1211]